MFVLSTLSYAGTTYGVGSSRPIIIIIIITITGPTHADNPRPSQIWDVWDFGLEKIPDRIVWTENPRQNVWDVVWDKTWDFFG